jgi:hypothetical protein
MATMPTLTIQCAGLEVHCTSCAETGMVAGRTLRELFASVEALIDAGWRLDHETTFLCPECRKRGVVRQDLFTEGSD